MDKKKLKSQKHAWLEVTKINGHLELTAFSVNFPKDVTIYLCDYDSPFKNDNKDPYTKQFRAELKVIWPEH
jgi:hypothetical protein